MLRLALCFGVVALGMATAHAQPVTAPLHFSSDKSMETPKEVQAAFAAQQAAIARIYTDPAQDPEVQSLQALAPAAGKPAQATVKSTNEAVHTPPANADEKVY